MDEKEKEMCDKIDKWRDEALAYIKEIQNNPNLTWLQKIEILFYGKIKKTDA